MAEQEEIIILEADDDSQPLLESQNGSIVLKTTDSKTEDTKQEDARARKKNIFIVAVVATLLLVIMGIIFTFVFSKKDDKQPIVSTEQIVENIIKKENKEVFSPSKLENTIKKANILYERGNKDEALKLYEKIATFSEAISHYNIGVAKMKENEFKDALESFKKAILNREHRCISAINASVCALELNDKKLFQYYIDLAYAYLFEEANMPLYSYYAGLINYYKNLYYEASSALSHPTGTYYKTEHNYLLSKTLAFLGDNAKSVDALQRVATEEDSFTLGLLYAKMGEFKVAKEYLAKGLSNTNNPLKIKSALAIIENKLGNLENAGSLLLEIHESKDEKALKTYPIKATLKPSLFDVTKAQGEFEKELFFSDEKAFSLIFYYAPYKVFDAKQTIDYIRKGSMNIFIDEIGPALQYLKTSSTISKVNISISKAIKKALDSHIKEANDIFLQMVDEYKNHSILHYNLALTYAQSGNYTEAYKNFSKSYHLDSKNYLAGAFAIMCGKLVGKDVTKLVEDVKDSLEKKTKEEKNSIYHSLIYLTEDNQFSLLNWAERVQVEKDNTPLYLILDIIVSQKISNDALYRKSTQRLHALLPNDIIANVIAFNAKHNKDDIKSYAKAIQIEFSKLPLDMNSFYYGPKIAKEQYVKMMQIGGLLHRKKDDIRVKMEEEKTDVSSIMQTLAYLNIYSNDFEEAYTMYNELIDNFNIKDTNTLFLAAMAAVGSNHPENAIALLELSKLTDSGNLEARYALGVLYQEVSNFEAAAIQYKKIGNIGFSSKYFSFNINNQ
ncbi:MAG: hypothetical protein PHN38_03530 [Sulfurospirillaceae bacterium]|nr:hypothetical protein [Sulfurospirillaceae bacterium]